MRNIRVIFLGTLLVLSGVGISGTATAQAQHPYYLQALTDLRVARDALQQHVNGKPMTHNDKEALRQINEVMMQINRASIDDKEPVHRQKAQESQDDAARLRQCLEFLKKAKDNLSHEQDASFAGGLRGRSISNCDAAMRFVEQTRHALHYN